MNPRDNGNIRPRSTIDDGELPPLPPRSGTHRSVRKRPYLSDRDVEVRSHATSLLGIPNHSSSEVDNPNHGKIETGPTRKLERTNSDSSIRSWQNCSWDGTEMKKFMEEISNEPLQQDLPSMEEVTVTAPRKPLEDREKQRRIRLLGLTCVVVLAIGLAVGLSQKGDTSKPRDSEVPVSRSSERMNKVVSFLGNGVSSSMKLATVGSHQHSAAQWIADVDPLRYDVPEAGASREENYHFIQRYALAVFYYSLGGQNWEFNLSFLGDDHECAWFERNSELTGGDYAAGVMCDSYLHVEDILIPGNNLTGEMPVELGLLTDIDFLSLEGNNIAGTFPESLRNLTHLKYLNLNDNDVSGVLPLWLEELEHLKVLGLSNNNIDEAIPRWHLPLRTLALDGNNMTGTLLPLNDLTTLKYVYMDENNFETVIDSSFLTQLNNLVQLGLSRNKLRGSFPGHLLSGEELVVLDLSNNNLTGLFPEHVSEHTNVQFLSIDGNSIDTSDAPDFIRDILDSSESYRRSLASFGF